MTVVKITNAILGEPATKYADNKDFDPGDGETQLFSVGKDRFIALQSSEPFHTSYRGPSSYVTTVSLNGQSCVTEGWLQQMLAEYRSIDDVFHNEFLSGIMFTEAAKEKGLDISPRAHKLLKSLGTAWIEVVETPDAEITGATLLPGPYLTGLSSPASFQAEAPRELHVGVKYVQTISIAVRSRLRGVATKEKPLCNMRIAVKDIFKIEGIRTSVCNKAYYELYPPATETAGCIKILEEAGATIVGTTKLASFAATEEPLECIDFQAPWNPRADGYQSPAGSSSGSGARTLAVVDGGQDTGMDALQCGHRMEFFLWRAILQASGSLTFPHSSSRNIKTSKMFADQWYGDRLPKTVALPPTIIYASDYTALVSNKDQLEIIDHFVTDLESSLGVRQTRISFASLWDASPPKEANGQSLQEYMEKACRDSFFHDDYHNFDKFRLDFERKFSKTPYVSPPAQWQWVLSAKITKDERDVAVARLEVSRFCPVGVPMLFLSPITGGPELTIPVGQVPFHSRVSGRVEPLPVAVSLLASPGRDIGLLGQAQKCLETSGRPTIVHTGKELFGD
ncbi:hypothetical protein JMJ35_004844 [Cladonia borealis]|uniref:Amidase n=1 Tax=Cladonia borealis TaxID=184061 RepID=A0AA39R0T3_9LECA|nr:hypothetical protein JMJ35_004844 [Cladonia borealis]